MSKRNKIIYWIATIFLAFGMLAGGLQQLFQWGGYVAIITASWLPEIFHVHHRSLESTRRDNDIDPGGQDFERMGLRGLLLCHVGSGYFPFGDGRNNKGNLPFPDIADRDGNILVFQTSQQKGCIGSSINKSL